MTAGYERATHTDADRAALLLLELRETGRTIPELPDGLRPGPLDEAYDIQDALHRRGSWKIGVLKVGATSAQAQSVLGVPEPLAGRIQSGRIYPDESHVDMDIFHHPPLVECEFGLRVGRDIQPYEQLSETEVASVVDAVVPAIELVDSRFDDLFGASGPSLVADNSVCGAVVLGEAVTVTTEDLSDLAGRPATLRMFGSVIVVGKGSAAFGHPLMSLAWMLDHERSRKRVVPRGTVVITGTCTGLVPCLPGAETVGDFGPFGRVKVVVGESAV